RDVPYDRPRTTMAAFAMCKACRREYDDPTNRRFHAEPIACPACGPQLTYLGAGSARPIAVADAALQAAVAAVARGEIVAAKGVGGFVLVVDAANERAVARLRERKRRPHKAFAIMAAALPLIDEVVELDDAARRALTSPVRPIILAP